MANNYLNPYCARSVTCVGDYLYESGTTHCDRNYPEHILIYFLSGSWEIWQNGVAYTPQAGDCLFLHAHNHHYGFKKCEPGTHTLFFHFSWDPSDCIQLEANPALEESHLCFPTVFSCSNVQSFERRFRQIQDLFWSSNTPKRTIRLNSYLQLLLTDLYEKVTVAPDAIQIIKLTNKLIQENPKRNIQIEELAQQLNVSKRTAIRRFRLATQTSFLQYQIEYRLVTAFNLLKNNPQLTNKEVALKLGFYDEYHFGKMFRKHFGNTPTAVRTGKKDELN